MGPRNRRSSTSYEAVGQGATASPLSARILAPLVHGGRQEGKLSEPVDKVERMFDQGNAGGSQESALARLVSEVGALEPDRDPAAGLRRIRLLEELKSAAAAAQARQAVAFAEARRAEQGAAGVAQARLGQGIGDEVALAKRCSPFQGRRFLGWAGTLADDMPATLAALQSGRVSEWRAILVTQESAWLSPAQRRAVDAEIAPRLAQLGDRQAAAEVKRLGYRIDPHGYVDRIRSAEADRRVTLRPAADAMARLSALLPVRQGVAVLAALTAAADTPRPRLSRVAVVR
jgi:hypothetical protein